VERYAKARGWSSANKKAPRHSVLSQVEFIFARRPGTRERRNGCRLRSGKAVLSPLSGRGQGSLYRAGIAINDREVSAHGYVWLRPSLFPILNRPGIQRITPRKLGL
jgi:hypothetical protein